MNPFNRTAINPNRPPRSGGRNDALTHVRAAIRRQRQNWSTQTGKPPIPQSRAGHGWENWETTLVQEQQDHMTLADLATWTGRTADEVLHYLESLEDDLVADEFENDEDIYIY